MRIGAILIIGACCWYGWIPAQRVAAEGPEPERIYQWQDDQGILHVTDSLDKVPTKYRQSVKSAVIPSTESGKPTAPAETTRMQPAPASPPADREEPLKMAWQQRMRQARQNVTRLTEQLEVREKQLQLLKERWGSGLYGYPADVASQVTQLEHQIRANKEALEQARKTVEEDIPEAARKAGVPPGWLRE